MDIRSNDRTKYIKVNCTVEDYVVQSKGVELTSAVKYSKTDVILWLQSLVI